MHARMRRRMLCLVFECKFIDHHSSTSSPLITSNVEIKYQKNPILHTGQLNTYSRISQTLLFKIFTCALDRKKEESNFGYIWQMLSNINCLLVTNNDNQPTKFSGKYGSKEFLCLFKPVFSIRFLLTEQIFQFLNFIEFRVENSCGAFSHSS